MSSKQETGWLWTPLIIGVVVDGGRAGGAAVVAGWLRWGPEG